MPSHTRRSSGDATDDAVLRAAGIERAAALVAAVDSDAANSFIALSARALNPGLFIVARARSQDSEEKLVAPEQTESSIRRASAARADGGLRAASPRRRVRRRGDARTESRIPPRGDRHRTGLADSRTHHSRRTPARPHRRPRLGARATATGRSIRIRRRKPRCGPVRSSSQSAPRASSTASQRSSPARSRHPPRPGLTERSPAPSSRNRSRSRAKRSGSVTNGRWPPSRRTTRPARATGRSSRSAKTGGSAGPAR